MIKSKKGTRKSRSASVYVCRDSFATVASQMSARIVTERLVYVNTTFASTGTGAINGVYPIRDPTLASDWTNFSNTYQEFRVVAAKIKFLPKDRYSKTTTVCQPLVGVIDLVDSSALTSMSSAAQNISLKWLSLEDPWQLEWRLRKDDTLRTGWYDTAGGWSFNESFKFFSSGLSLSTNYGTVFMEYIVEFKGRD